MELVSVLKDYMNALLFPKKICLLCEKPITSSIRMNYICNTCEEQVDVPKQPYCNYCHKPMHESMQPQDKQICGDCKQHLHNQPSKESTLPINRSSTLYNDTMKDLLALYKYRGKESLAKPFSYLLKTAYEQYFAKEKIDLITFVPLHPNRLQERGFNQAEQLAERLGDLTGISVHPTLERVKETEKQSKHTKKERTEQIIDSFQIIGDIKHFSHQNILIIDDIYTTGSTILECTRILQQNGVKSVKSLTLSRAFDQIPHDKL